MSRFFLCVLVVALAGCASSECLRVHASSVKVTRPDGSVVFEKASDTIDYCPPTVETVKPVATKASAP